MAVTRQPGIVRNPARMFVSISFEFNISQEHDFNDFKLYAPYTQLLVVVLFYGPSR